MFSKKGGLTVSASERKIGPIEVRWGSDHYKYCIVGDSFITEWKKGMDYSKSCWSLQGVSPTLVETIGRSSETTKTARISMALMASSIIVFFSEYNKAIPLLAPFLLGLGAWWFIGILRKVAPRSWTEVRKPTGEYVFSLVQPEKKTKEWSEFEQELVNVIREVNAEKT
jgi:hypothetical protein